ncbi:MAG: DUF6077 domain-containing protein [Roseburia sp.]|nr:DUF6077 domain-containing protein [Roseburia sp.]
MILIPWLLGKGSLLILYGKRADRELFIGDSFLTGWIVSIGLAEAAHASVTLLGRSFSDCVKLFVLSVLICCAAAILILAVHYLLLKNRKSENNIIGKTTAREKTVWLLFILMFGAQLLTLLFNHRVYRGGDMTLETVKSFLATDAIYQVNPLTGRAYELGMPSRLKLLCLPSLYGALSRVFQLEPETVVWVLVPLVTLIASYLAYGTVARALFQENRFGAGCFMVSVALLVWVGDSMYGMEGFGLLHSGFRGVTIRSAVLAPYTVGLMLRGKWKLSVLCILAEACIVWTLYGFGMCFLVAAGMSLTGLVLKWWKKRRQAQAKEEQVWQSW